MCLGRGDRWRLRGRIYARDYSPRADSPWDIYGCGLLFSVYPGRAGEEIDFGGV